MKRKTKSNGGDMENGKKVLMRAGDAAKALEISTRQIYRMCEDGRLASVRFGKRMGLRIKSESVKELLRREG
jgi:excisionase family DNA binding protein